MLILIIINKSFFPTYFFCLLQVILVSRHKKQYIFWGEMVNSDVINPTQLFECTLNDMSYEGVLGACSSWV